MIARWQLQWQSKCLELQCKNAGIISILTKLLQYLRFGITSITRNSYNISDFELQALQQVFTIRFQPNANRETHPASSLVTIRGVLGRWGSKACHWGGGRLLVLDGSGLLRWLLADLGSAANSRTSVCSSSTAGEVSSGIPNRILVDGAPFGLLHPAPPSAKAPAQPSGGGIDPGRWHPFRPPSSGAPFGGSPEAAVP
jgi:hypothetical protein